MKAQVVVSKQGDRLDQIAHRFYGTLHGQTVAAVLDANPTLCLVDAVLPVGVSVIMPPLAAETGVDRGVKLWD